MTDDYKMLTRKLVVFLYKQDNRDKEISIATLSEKLNMKDDSVRTLIHDNSKYFVQFAEANVDSGEGYLYLGTRTVRIKLSNEGLVYARELKLRGYTFFQNNFIYPIFMKFSYTFVGLVVGFICSHFTDIIERLISIFR
ncbi:hypothetical protein [Leuconostoc mesenteroides]|uniref:hypothetical protein n=1 Tax=Leuconostoc mesenteroides TaxID=1245 RepID=UPI00235E08E8|nr:hypothetical protein [Leuconostoc mesenteroides]